MLYRLTPRDGVSLKHRLEVADTITRRKSIGQILSLSYVRRDYKSNYPVDYRREDHIFDWLGSTT